jgi:hypothetical protein
MTAAAAFAGSAHSTAVFVGSGTNGETGNSVQGQAEFTVSGTNLILQLFNSDSNPTDGPGDVVTGITFDLAGGATLSINLAAPGPCGMSLNGETLWTSQTTNSTGADVCGSWTDQLAAGATVDFGLATTGFSGLFNGGSISVGNAGPNYGIASSSTDFSSFAPGGFPVVQHSLTFTYDISGAPLLESQITNVTFLFGTSGEGSVTGACQAGTSCIPLEAPEPGTLTLLALAGAGLLFASRRRRS